MNQPRTRFVPADTCRKERQPTPSVMRQATQGTPRSFVGPVREESQYAILDMVLATHE